MEILSINIPLYQGILLAIVGWLLGRNSMIRQYRKYRYMYAKAIEGLFLGMDGSLRVMAALRLATGKSYIGTLERVQEMAIVLTNARQVLKFAKSTAYGDGSHLVCRMPQEALEVVLAGLDKFVDDTVKSANEPSKALRYVSDPVTNGEVQEALAVMGEAVGGATSALASLGLQSIADLDKFLKFHGAPKGEKFNGWPEKHR